MKPRGDAKLKMLPKAIQAKIIAWLDSTTQQKVVEKIAAELNVSTSPAALSKFYEWYGIASQLEEAASLADDLKASLKDLPDFSRRTALVNKAAQAVFEIQALKKRDAKLHIALRRQSAREDTVQLNRDRFEIEVCGKALDMFEEKVAREIAESSAPRAEKIAALRKAYYADVDELQKSGKVVLPK